MSSGGRGRRDAFLHLRRRDGSDRFSHDSERDLEKRRGESGEKETREGFVFLSRGFVPCHVHHCNNFSCYDRFVYFDLRMNIVS